jgi:potassium-transporting ATPase ATP-binding subunit
MALIPIALHGVRFALAATAALLRRNLLIYGAVGLIAPFVGITVVDLTITGLGLV